MLTMVMAAAAVIAVPIAAMVVEGGTMSWPRVAAAKYTKIYSLDARTRLIDNPTVSLQCVQ